MSSVAAALDNATSTPTPTSSAHSVADSDAMSSSLGLRADILEDVGQNQEPLLRCWSNLLRAEIEDSTKLDNCYTTFCRAIDVRPNKTLLRFFSRKGASDNITHMRLADLTLGDRGLLAFLACLHLMPNLVRIDLSYSRMASVHVLIICEVLRSHPSVESVNLSHNKFGSVAAQALLEVVVSNELISEVELEGVEMLGSIRRRIDACTARNKM